MAAAPGRRGTFLLPAAGQGVSRPRPADGARAANGFRAARGAHPVTRTRAAHRDGVVAAVLSGFVIGYALALIVGPAGAIALVHANKRSGFAQQIAPPGTNVVALSVVIHFAGIIVLTAIGMVLGMA